MSEDKGPGKSHHFHKGEGDTFQSHQGGSSIEGAREGSVCGGWCHREWQALLCISELLGAQKALPARPEYWKLGLNPLGDHQPVEIVRKWKNQALLPAFSE